MNTKKEMSEHEYSQTYNPKSKSWILVDKTSGSIIESQDEPFQDVKIVVHPLILQRIVQDAIKQYKPLLDNLAKR